MNVIAARQLQSLVAEEAIPKRNQIFSTFDEEWAVVWNGRVVWVVLQFGWNRLPVVRKPLLEAEAMGLERTFRFVAQLRPERRIEVALTHVMATCQLQKRPFPLRLQVSDGT